MPTIYTKCSECNYHNVFNINHKFNKNHKGNLEKSFILKSLGLPNELCIKIINDSYEYNNCTYCKRILCKEHTDRSIQNAKYYHVNGKICESCCWFEIG